MIDPRLRTATVLCVGETMGMLATPPATRLEDADHLEVHVAGAESNVAIALADLGISVEWFSRLGHDAVGRLIRGRIESRAVDVSVVEDEFRPSGLMLKDSTGDAAGISYYRLGSAASGLSVADIPAMQLSDRELVHVSGVTPALSPTCDVLVERLLSGRPRSALMSFDVNHRERLWSSTTAAPRLRELAHAADVVFVGLDEAERLWSTSSPEEVRNLFPDVAQLVVKDADRGATWYSRDDVCHQASLTVDVVEPVGAGDSFAAGFLAGMLGGWPPRRSLRLGHLVAAHALTSVADTPSLPPRAELDELTLTPDADWGELRISAEGVSRV